MVKLRDAVTDEIVFEDAGITGEFNVSHTYGVCALPERYAIEAQCDRYKDAYRSQVFDRYGDRDNPLDLGLITLRN